MTDFVITLQEHQLKMLHDTQFEHCQRLNEGLYRAKTADKPDGELIRIREEHYKENIQILSKLAKEVQS